MQANRNIGKPPSAEPPSLAELLRQLATESATLVRGEFALARKEVLGSLQVLMRSLAVVAVGGVVSLLALGTLTAAAVIAIGNRTGYAGAALGVGIVLAAAAAGVSWFGVRRLRATSLKPERTIESLETTVEEGKRWIKDLT